MHKMTFWHLKHIIMMTETANQEEWREVNPHPAQYGAHNENVFLIHHTVFTAKLPETCHFESRLAFAVHVYPFAAVN